MPEPPGYATYPLVSVDSRIAKNDLDVLEAAFAGALAAGRRIESPHIDNADQVDGIVGYVSIARTL